VAAEEKAKKVAEEQAKKQLELELASRDPDDDLDDPGPPTTRPPAKEVRAYTHIRAHTYPRRQLARLPACLPACARRCRVWSSLLAAACIMMISSPDLTCVSSMRVRVLLTLSTAVHPIRIRRPWPMRMRRWRLAN
jgi:hypothetical protein